MTPMEIVRAFMSAMERKDYPAALGFVSQDCEYTNIPMGTVRGPEAIRAVLEPFFAPIDENEFTILRAATEGEIIFVERLDRHRIEDRWFELPVAGVLEVRDGRIMVWREYFDLATLQAGLKNSA